MRAAGRLQCTHQTTRSWIAGVAGVLILVALIATWMPAFAAAA